MSTTFFDDDADLALVQQRNVAVLGFTGQGQAQALALRDSGVDLRIGVPPSSAGRTAADAEGLRVLTPYEACEEADLVVLLAPNVAQRTVYDHAVAPNLVAGDAVVFGVGFDVTFGFVQPAAGVDVCLVAPQAPPAVVRREFTDGRGAPVLVAVEQDASGQAWELTLSYAKAIGGTRAGAVTTTFAEATHTLLFGQQVVAGGVQELVHAGYATLLEAGYQPAAAYLQCVAEARAALAALGAPEMPRRKPDAAGLGEQQGGPQLVDASVQARMRALLARIADGDFAQRFVAAQAGGAPQASRAEAADADMPVAGELRSLLGRDSPSADVGDDEVLADSDDPQIWLS